MIEVLCAFLIGTIYEFEASRWALACSRREPWRAAAASFACGMCLVLGVGLALTSVWVGFAYAVGYAVGTWLAVRQ